MSPKIAQAIGMIVGTFVVVMLAMSVLLYGWQTVIVLAVGLFVIAAVGNALMGGKSNNRGK